eukprot:2406065-Rhodomonas_salina.3
MCRSSLISFTYTHQLGQIAVLIRCCDTQKHRMSVQLRIDSGGDGGEGVGDDDDDDDNNINDDD